MTATKTAPNVPQTESTPLYLGRPSGRRTTVDVLMRILAWAAGVIALVPLLWILITVVISGAPNLFTVQPDYTRLCTVQGQAPDNTYSDYQRVSASQCDSGAAGASWRWLPYGKYPKVGDYLPANPQSVSTNPWELDPKAVIGQPTRDSAGTIRSFSLGWWTMDGRVVPDNKAGGGALHALVGTLWIGLITSVIAVPLGVLAAYYLVEYARGTRAGRVVTFMVDILTGVPSIVAGLFIFAVIITILHGHRSIFAASLALVLLMIPTVLRSTEEMLKLVPDTLREASYALGVPKWTTILRVVTPTAFDGIVTGVILGLARVMGETAPLLILVQYTTNLSLNPFGLSMGTLPTMIQGAANLPTTYPGADRGWSAALTLILIVMGLNLLARWIGSRSKIKER